MNARDFCYWLQGAFEIADCKNMTAEQVSMLKAHLLLVEHLDPAHDNTFVAFLTVRLNGVQTLSAKDTEAIRRFLDAQFKHELDPSYVGDKATLQKIHDGDDERPVMRR